MASASVPVLRAEASTLNAMPSASPASWSSSKTFGCRVAPRPITGPEPRWWAPCSRSSTPGTSVACVTSTTIATSGWIRCATVRAPPSVVSSWAAATATTSPPAPPASETSRAASSATKQPRRLSSERETRRSLGNSSGSASITATSPTRTSARAASPSRAPMSMCRSRSSGTRLRSSSRSRWMGLRPTTPGTAPSRVATETRWPTSTCGSQPPTPANHRKSLSSMWVRIRPISSMCPTTATVSPPPVPATRAVEEPSRSPSTSVNAPAWRRQAAAGAPSYPEGPCAARRSRSRSGSAMKAETLRRLAELSQYEVQDPAVPEVQRLLGRVDPDAAGELVVSRLDRHLARRLLARVERLGDPGDRELLVALEAQGLRALAVGELQRKHAHPDQVRSVDALEALGDHRPDAEQRRALRRPVTRRARAIFLAGEHHERRVLLDVGPRGVVDRHDFIVLLGEAALLAVGELVAQADVGERAAHHHLVVAAPRPVGVEVALGDAVLLEVGARGESSLIEPAGEMWSVVTLSPSLAS